MEGEGRAMTTTDDRECPIARHLRINRAADVAEGQRVHRVGHSLATCHLCFSIIGASESSPDGTCAIRKRLITPVLLDDTEDLFLGCLCGGDNPECETCGGTGRTGWAKEEDGA